MKTSRWKMALLMALGVAVAAPVTCAAERGRTGGGEEWISGGIGQEEVQALREVRQGFSLWVRTALRGSGEYLADVRVRIADAQGRTVFDEALDGPWLLIAVKPGTYQVHASWRGQSQARTVRIAAQGQRELMFYFDAPADAPGVAAGPRTD